MSYYTDVTDWHRKFGVPVADQPTPLTPDRRQLRLALLREEYAELVEALLTGDLANSAKEAADLIVVTLGTMAEAGVPFDAVWAEVMASIHSKAEPDGTVHKRADGKILKGSRYHEANVAAVLAGIPTAHVIRVHEDADADLRTYTFECRALVGASCRRWCLKPNCDREEGLPHRDDTPHPEGDIGRCIQAEWLNAYDIADCIGEDESVLGVIEDNTPIVITWDYDSYVWTLAATPQAVTA